MLTRSVFLLAAVAAGSIVPASARVLEAKVPFAFELNGKALPAGRFEIEVNPHHGLAMFRAQGGEAALSATSAGTLPARQSPLRLTFWKSAGTYTLIEIAVGENVPARLLPVRRLPCGEEVVVTLQ